MSIVVRGYRPCRVIVDGRQRVSAGITGYPYPNATIAMCIRTGRGPSYYSLSRISTYP